MTTTERPTDRISSCPRCLGGMLIPGWEPGERSCLNCGYEAYPRTLLEEIARAEAEAPASSPAQQAHIQRLAARRRAEEWKGSLA